MIPLLNANNYTITLTGIAMFANSTNTADVSGWNIKKSKNGFSMEKNDSNSVKYFDLYPNTLFVINYTVS